MKLMALLIIGIWLGMVIGLSFIEAPLKFQAPNITLALGLGIGKLVFGVLNKIEILFSIIVFIWMLMNYRSIDPYLFSSLLTLFVIVVAQSIYLLPRLDSIAELVIAGVDIEESNLHIQYVFLEILKVLVLFYSFKKVYQYD